MSNEYPLVSVIIPTYGRANMLCRAIDSVLLQTYKNIEVIIVNDNPKTSEHYNLTMKVLAQYSNNQTVKIFADGANRGGSLARNKGIEISIGEFITFLDDDDYYYKDKIEKQVRGIFENFADMCVCNMDVLKESKVFDNLSKCKARANNLENFIVDGNCYTPMILVKKKILQNVGMFTNSPRFQDHILVLKLLSENIKVVSLSYSGFVHDDNDHERITNMNKTKLAYEIRYKYEESFIKKTNFKRKFFKKYWFKRNLEQSWFMRQTGDIYNSFLHILKSLCYVTSMLDIYYLFKALIAIFLSYIKKF